MSDPSIMVAVPRDFLVAVDSELSAIVHGRPPQDAEQLYQQARELANQPMLSEALASMDTPRPRRLTPEQLHQIEGQHQWSELDLVFDEVRACWSEIEQLKQQLAVESSMDTDEARVAAEDVMAMEANQTRRTARRPSQIMLALADSLDHLRATQQDEGAQLRQEHAHVHQLYTDLEGLIQQMKAKCAQLAEKEAQLKARERGADTGTVAAG